MKKKSLYIGIISIVLSELGGFTQIFLGVSFILGGIGIVLGKRESSKFGLLLNGLAILLSFLNLLYFNMHSAAP